jgi:glutathione S-transferase
LQHRALLVEFARDPSYAERNELLLKKPLRLLNDALGKHKYLAGDGFTVADINVASVVTWGKAARLDLSPYPEISHWLDDCLSRSAYKRLRDMIRR